MGTVSRRIDIYAPSSSVWAVLEDVRLLPTFSPSTVEVVAPPALTRRNQQFDQTIQLAGRRFTSTWTVTDIDPGCRLVIEGSVLPGTLYTMTQELAVAGEDRSTLSLTTDYHLPFGLLGRVAARLGADGRALDEAAQVLAGVKRVAEGRHGSPWSTDMIDPAPAGPSGTTSRSTGPASSWPT